MGVTDDTQPRSPFKNQPPQPQYVLPEEDIAPAGPGCLVWGLVAVVCLGCAVVVVLLAGTAGWRDGRRVAQVTSTSAIAATANSQLTRIPQDMQSGNLYMLDRRIQYLQTLLPDMPGLPGIAQTATALYLNSQPTITPTPSPTPLPVPSATAVELEPESTDVVAPTESGSTYDLDALLQEARDAMNQNLWADAIATLDVVIAIDSSFNQATVSGLMLQALRSEAHRLYNEGKLAEAILLTTRAEDFGLTAEDDLRYERYVAGLYLDANRSIGIDYQSAINALRKVYDLGPGRYYDEVTRLLFDQYVAYGDAWVAGQDYCPAVQQYQNALTILNSAQIVAKRDDAQTRCTQATTMPGAGGTTQPVAPVGVIQTPGS